MFQLIFHTHRCMGVRALKSMIELNFSFNFHTQKHKMYICVTDIVIYNYMRSCVSENVK